MQQGSAEWFAERCGKLTASRLYDALARQKSGKFYAARETYMGELIAERLTGETVDRPTTWAMQWGTEMEPAAKAAYAWYAGDQVQSAPFVPHPRIDMSGASPDGYVGEGLIEIKCPQTTTHINTLLGGDIDERYQMQMLWQMACTGRPWCDFVSFDPRMPEDLRLCVRRFYWDGERALQLEADAIEFLAEVAARVDALNRLRAL